MDYTLRQRTIGYFGQPLSLVSRYRCGPNGHVIDCTPDAA
jgi:hypothetical protein